LESQPEASVTDCDFAFGTVLPKNPSLTLFEVAMFKTAGNQWAKNTGDYHNPTRQRGIYGNTCKTRQLNRSLTFLVVMGTR
jgi:hypothetical protein